MATTWIAVAPTAYAAAVTVTAAAAVFHRDPRRRADARRVLGQLLRASRK